MTAAELVGSLESVRARGPNKYSAKCPAHADKSPSLTIAEGDKGLLVKCWAGCSLQAICESLGIHQKDLFFDTPTPHGRRPPPKPVKIDRDALAFRYELAALDLRLRASRIIEAGKRVNVATLDTDELDHALGYVVRAYADIERAEVFEATADTLRERAFSERKSRERQTCVA